MGKGDGKKNKGRGGRVIHVQFGTGGGKLTAPPAEPTPEPVAREPVTDLFTPREVTKLLNLTAARLRTLDRAAIVSPSGEKNGKRAYTFQDLIALRATLMLSRDVKLREVQKAIGALRQTLPRVTRPLQELRIVSDGRRVVVRARDGSFEPVTGQMVMDFQLDALRDDVVRVLRPETPASRAKTAYDFYVRASELDEDPQSFEHAEAMYRKAIELDPTLAIAYTNLGNILFRRGDDQEAEALYARAIAIDLRQPEAHYNLGYVMLERGEAARAAVHFEAAIERDPRFADAHFNLAMALEQLGESERARRYWKKYLELEPQGTWADIARKHL
jgi:tetratricopeptide (TPR) repeat protein